MWTNLNFATAIHILPVCDGDDIDSNLYLYKCHIWRWLQNFEGFCAFVRLTEEGGARTVTLGVCVCVCGFRGHLTRTASVMGQFRKSAKRRQRYSMLIRDYIYIYEYMRRGLM